MEEQEVATFLRHRAAVHQLCSGAFLQFPIRLTPAAIAAPVVALGYDRQADYAALYAREIAGAPVDGPALENLRRSGREALPVVAIAVHMESGGPDEMERRAAPLLARGRKLVSWGSGEHITPFAMVVATATDSHFRLLVPPSRRRIRLGPIAGGGAQGSLQQQVDRLMTALDEDEHFELAVTLFHEALGEGNVRFQIARFFNVLECLAYKLKGGGVGSRRAVRQLLELEAGATSECNIGGKKYRFDCVEIGGRIRDALLHGAHFREEDLIAEARSAFELYQTHPEQIASPLQMHCELQIARWANGASGGRNPPPVR